MIFIIVVVIFFFLSLPTSREVTHSYVSDVLYRTRTSAYLARRGTPLETDIQHTCSWSSRKDPVCFRVRDTNSILPSQKRHERGQRDRINSGRANRSKYSISLIYRSIPILTPPLTLPRLLRHFSCFYWWAESAKFQASRITHNK